MVSASEDLCNGVYFLFMSRFLARTNVTIDAEDFTNSGIGLADGEDGLDLGELVVDGLFAVTSNADHTMDFGTLWLLECRFPGRIE